METLRRPTAYAYRHSPLSTVRVKNGAAAQLKQSHHSLQCICSLGTVVIMVKRRTDHKFSLVLPVLFYEYLAISITRSLIPKMIVNYYGNKSYLAVGIIETAKGCLAFLSCPIFGRLSDRIGRKYCLLVTVIGTTLPVCMMAFTDNMIIYGIMMSLSGFFR